MGLLVCIGHQRSSKFTASRLRVKTLLSRNHYYCVTDVALYHKQPKITSEWNQYIVATVWKWQISKIKDLRRAKKLILCLNFQKSVSQKKKQLLKIHHLHFFFIRSYMTNNINCNTSIDTVTSQLGPGCIFADLLDPDPRTGSRYFYLGSGITTQLIFLVFLTFTNSMTIPKQ